MIAALLASHGGQVWRHGKAIVLYGAMLGLLTLVGLVYLEVLVTHVLALLIGTTGALGLMTALAGIGGLLFLGALRRAKRRLVAAHRQHLEQERLALRAAGVEAVEAGKLSGSIAAVSASLAAAIVLVLRRLGPGQETQEERPPEG